MWEANLSDFCNGMDNFIGTITITVGQHKVDFHDLICKKILFNYGQKMSVIYEKQLYSELKLEITYNEAQPHFKIISSRENSILSIFIEVYHSNYIK